VATPHVFIFDQDRKLRFQGRIDNSEREDLAKAHDTRDALDALLAGREPEVKTTRVFGCSIKWKDKIADNERWMAKVAKEPVALTKVDAAGLKALRANVDSGKVRLVNFWATWCGPCVSEFDELIEQNLRFRHRSFELVTVAAQFPDEEAKVLKFLQDHHASTRNLIFGETDKYALIEAFDKEKQTPIKGAQVVMHPYRATTDENGIARVKVTKGHYDIFISAAKYVSIATSADVTADMITRADLDGDSPWVSPDEYPVA